MLSYFKLWGLAVPFPAFRRQRERERERERSEASIAGWPTVKSARHDVNSVVRGDVMEWMATTLAPDLSFAAVVHSPTARYGASLRHPNSDDTVRRTAVY